MSGAEAATYVVTIYMAGDVAHARQVVRAFVLEGLCVTLEPTDYVYTGGVESGFRIGLLNYPRFPSSPSEILQKAVRLAARLREDLAQHSFLIVTPEKTYWDSLR